MKFNTPTDERRPVSIRIDPEAYRTLRRSAASADKTLAAFLRERLEALAVDIKVKRA